MADDRKTPDETFLQRWARRKSEATSPAPDPADTGVETAALDNAPPATAPPGDEAETSEVDLAALPDIDSLDETSDFSVFMQDGVPEALRTKALQRLWRLDPSFGHIDGLLDYGEDFTATGLAAEAVKTIYKVGKGMLSDEADEAEEAAADAAADDAGMPAATEHEREATDAAADDAADDAAHNRDDRNEAS